MFILEEKKINVISSVSGAITIIITVIVISVSGTFYIKGKMTRKK